MSIKHTEWAVSDGFVPYPAAVAFMETRAAAIAAGEAAEMVWMLEHPPLYTGGTSAKSEDLKDPERFPVYETGRGGEYTYHGPGQRVGYVMLDLTQRGRDARKFVKGLEDWIIGALAQFDVKADRRCGRVGVWVNRPDKGDGYEDKIAAIGVRLRRWVSFHGIAINVAPDLSHFNGITPCGIAEPKFGVTSLANLGIEKSLAETDEAFLKSFENVFGPVKAVNAPEI
ncbi:MAG: octanoyltransferase [Hyphobacterium sp.]|nr:MAG: octanoyltransferase [Hyphobacterium sp.]